MINNIYSFDFWLLNLIQTIRNPFLDKIMPFITHLGSGGFIWIVLGIALLLKKRTRVNGIKMLTALSLSFLFGVIIIKNLITRERPFIFDNALVTIDNMIVPPPSDRYSFPSGHTITAFASSLIAFKVNRRLGLIASVISLLIAFSRMYLYVHFPTDIIGAIILSFPSMLIANWIVDFILSKIKK